MNQIKSFSVYASTIFFNAAISFATFSLLTHYLNEVDYGIINLYNSFVIFLSPFIAIGIQYAMGVDYFKMDELSYRQHFTNALIIPAVSCVIFTILFVFFSSWIQTHTNTNLFFTLSIPFACLVTILYDIFLSLFRNKEKYLLFFLFSVFKNIIEVSFTMLFIIWLGYNWEGRLDSFLLTLAIVLVLIIYFIRRWHLFTGTFEKKDVGTIFKNGLPFVPERISMFVLGYSDRFFINYFEGTADVGFYSAGAQMAVIVNMVTITLINTFYPQIFKILSQTQPNYQKLKIIIFAFIGISFVASVGVIISIPLFFKWFVGPVFQKGQIYAVFLTVGVFFWAINAAFLPFLLNLKKNKLIMMISIVGMVLSLSVNYFNIKQYGALGATYTSILVYFFMAMATLLCVHKYYGLHKIFMGRLAVNADLK